jgi:hypothetical protein
MGIENTGLEHLILSFLKAAQVRAAAPRQSRRRRALEHDVLNAHLFAILAFAALVAILIHNVRIRLGQWDVRLPHPMFLEGAAWKPRQLDLYDATCPLRQPEGGEAPRMVPRGPAE